ncbi:hypothetical protein [Halorubrum sp. F4]|uniref:hypothetical protein n=1 Tax=Halorubrum sp. F4 TaxID=2989715 RepID=UPI0024804EF1|nr:hypothetical protein [Halorubrum sp. F4]
MPASGRGAASSPREVAGAERRLLGDLRFPVEGGATRQRFRRVAEPEAGEA